jgi:hypothetical protein
MILGKDGPMVLLSPEAQRLARHPDIAVVSDDVYSVLTERETLGFIHRVGNVYVALSGDILGSAVEVGQSLSWEQAIDMVRSR